MHGEQVDLEVENNDSNNSSSSFVEDLKEIFRLEHVRKACFHMSKCMKIVFEKVLIFLSFFQRFLFIIVTYWNQNLTGVPALMMFSNAIFQKAGIPVDYIGLASIGFFIVNFIASFGCALVVDRWGRKVTYTVSCTGMGCCLLLVFILSFFDGDKNVAYAIIAPVCLFNAFCQLGCLPIPFMLAAELTPVKNRGTVQSVGVSNGFLSQFIVITVFPLLVQSIDQYTFLIFAVFDFLAVFHIWILKVEMGHQEKQSLFLKRESSFIKSR